MFEINKKMKNVIIIVIDALRPKNLSLFGYNRKTDENIFKIAREGIVFQKNFSSCNSTAPALTSIFTGCYPGNHGILHQLPYTKQEEIDNFNKKDLFWLPEFLMHKGYETIAIDWIGLWFKRGFNYYGEGVYDNKKAAFNSAEKITKLAISKIESSNKPFFLFLHFWDTHFPFPHTFQEEENEKDMEKTLSKIKNISQREYLKKRIVNKGPYTIDSMLNKYDLSIKEVDKQIGNLYNFLIENKLLENTVLIILGDHGTNLIEHETYFSSSGLFDDSINTLLLMKLPRKESKKISHFVQEIDIAPTILDFLGFEIPDGLDGKSLRNLIDLGEPVRNKIFSFDGLCEDIRCIRTKNKKLILAKNNFCNLCKGHHHNEIEEYDLEKDPEEKSDIYDGKSELMYFLDDKNEGIEDFEKKEIISSKDWF